MTDRSGNPMVVKLDASGLEALIAKISEQVDWFDQHYYRRGEKFYPSVTTVLNAYAKPFLAQWRGDVGNGEANRVMREAQRHGSNVHRYLNHLLNRGILVFQQKVDDPNAITVNDQYEYLHLLRVVDFLNIVKPRVLMSEEILWSDAHEFAGTMDLLLEIDEGDYQVNGAKPLHIPGGVYVADLKTGKSVSNEAFWQTAAYAQALFEQTGLKVEGTLILHTQSSNQRGIEGFGVKIRNADEVRLDFRDFLKIYEVWKINPDPSKPKIFKMPGFVKLGAELTINKNNKRIN